jgi:hypothetical protein
MNYQVLATEGFGSSRQVRGHGVARVG